MRGNISRTTGTSAGGVVDVENRVEPAHGAPYSMRDRFTFDAARSVWRVELSARSPLRARGEAPAWTGDEWTFEVLNARGMRQRVRYELAGDQLRRTFETPADPETWRITGAELCNRGSEPPAKDACIAKDQPASVVALAAISLHDLPFQTPHGDIIVDVNLRADSSIAAASVVDTPSPYLSAPVLQTIRASTFRTAMRDCVPVASAFAFAVRFRQGRLVAR